MFTPEIYTHPYIAVNAEICAIREKNKMCVYKSGTEMSTRGNVHACGSRAGKGSYTPLCFCEKTTPARARASRITHIPGPVHPLPERHVGTLAGASAHVPADAPADVPAGALADVPADAPAGALADVPAGASAHVPAGVAVAGRDGSHGKDGASGKDGKNGLPGKDGNHGNDGSHGSDGKDGAPGKDGNHGKDGAPGKDGNHGKDGAPGKDGNHGKDGAPGKDGNHGKDGAPGKDGNHGKDGAPGKDGNHGKDGAPGKDGNHGKDGKDGTPGAPGRSGVPGVPGKDGVAQIFFSATSGPSLPFAAGSSIAIGKGTVLDGANLILTALPKTPPAFQLPLGKISFQIAGHGFSPTSLAMSVGLDSVVSSGMWSFIGSIWTAPASTGPTPHMGTAPPAFTQIISGAVSIGEGKTFAVFRGAIPTGAVINDGDYVTCIITCTSSPPVVSGRATPRMSFSLSIAM